MSGLREIPCRERFLDAAWAEQGLSPAALSAYRSDLQGLAPQGFQVQRQELTLYGLCADCAQAA